MSKYPLININGTNGKDLFDANMTAFTKLVDAIDAMQAATPHGRDWQTCRYPAAFSNAYNAHTTMIRDLIEMRDHIQNVIVAIDKQINR